MIRIVLPRLLRVASFRFAALYVGVFAGSALILGVAVFLEARSALQQQMEARIETEAAFLREEFQTDGLAHLIDVVRLRGQGASALDYLVEDRSGAHLVGEMPATPALKPGWTVIAVPHASEDGGRPERVRAQVSDLGGGVLLAVGVDLRQIGDLEEAIVAAFLWTVGLAAVLGIAGGALLSQAFLMRVDAIARTAEAIISGDLARRVPMRGTGDDLDRLAGTLNRMLDRIAILMESLRQVSSDVAHDLRTPLSRLYQRLEDARAHARSMADYESSIDAALDEARGLLETFSALLRIAQVEGASPRAGFSDVDLSAVTEAVSDAYRPDAEDAGHELTATIAQGVIVSGDQELLTQALANLVENALRHTPAGTHIGVRLHNDHGTGVVLTVEDDGPGVAAIDLPRLTDRFYRGERSRTTPGNGLGLSLVSAVAELHGARLDLDAMKPGLRVSLSFPAVERRQFHAKYPSSAPSSTRALGLVGVFGLATVLSGCAAYHPLPLPRRSNLASSMTDLAVQLPAGTNGEASRPIDLTRPLGIDDVGVLAILNDPDLKSEWGEISVAQAGLFQTTLLPNPSLTLGYGALLGGPGSLPSYAASLSQDITAIVTYHARVKSARAHVSEVNADLLWREWQVAQKARLLALSIYWAGQSIDLGNRELNLVSDALIQARAATAAGNLDLTALAPLLAAQASAEQLLASQKLNRLKDWQALDALLGLVPTVRFALAPPVLLPLPSDIEPLIAGLPESRPDLVALQLGYLSSQESVRAAILGQFPAFVLGGSWNSDTSGVRSAGPTATFDLPIFNRNQGQIGQARATRLLLHEQYQSRLDGTVGNIRGLIVQMHRLSADLVRARQAATSAEGLSGTARIAYAQHNLDQRTLTDYETTALQRELEVMALQRSLGEDQIMLTVELGIGLPPARIVPPDQNKTP